MDWDALQSNGAGDWVGAALAATGVLAGSALLRWLLIRIAERGRQKGAATPLRGLAGAVARRTHGAVILVAALVAGASSLTLPDGLAGVVRTGAAVALLAQIGLWGSAAIAFAARWQRARDPDREDSGVAEAGRYVGTLVLWSLVFVFALDNLGVEVTALVAALGIGGIAVALAAQGILGDLFASLAIVLDRPFAVGDFVAAGEMSGRVERIGVKTTHLRSPGGEQLVIGNSDLLHSRIRNYGRMRERRVVLNLGVTYETAPEQVEAIPGMIREAVGQHPAARFDRAHFTGFGESGLEFEAVYHMRDADHGVYMDTRQAINLALLRRFREAGVGFAFPTRTVQLSGRLPPPED